MISDFSSRPWRNLPATWVIHMVIRRPTHNKLIHMDFLYGSLYKGTKSMWIGVSVGWPAGHHVDHPCAGQISPWPARKVTDLRSSIFSVIFLAFCQKKGEDDEGRGKDLLGISALSGPVLRDTARLSQRYPPIARYGVFWCLNMANWVRYPLPLF